MSVFDFIEPDSLMPPDNWNNFDFYGIRLNLVDAMEEY